MTNPSEWHVGDFVSLETDQRRVWWLILAPVHKNSFGWDVTPSLVMDSSDTFRFDYLEVMFGANDWSGEHWCPHD